VVIGLSSQNAYHEAKEVSREKMFVKAAEVGDVNLIKKIIGKQKYDINCMVSSSFTRLCSLSHQINYFHRFPIYHLL